MNQVFYTSTHTVSAGEIEVITSDTQHAKTIVFVHGLAVSERYLRPLVHELSATYNTISLNLPGFGDTKKPATVLSISELAESLKEFLILRGVVAPILVGQSMGCQIVAKLAAQDEGMIDKIILLSPTTNRKERSVLLQFTRLMQDSIREPLKLNVILIKDFFKFGLLRALRTANYMVSDKIETSVEKLNAQLLILSGSNDKIVPPAWTTYLARQSKQAEAVTLRGQPHNFQFTQPRVAATVCIDFIEQ